MRVPVLTNGKPVTFKVRAANAAGTSTDFLPSFAVTPSDQQVQLPHTPSAVAAYPGRHGEVSIHFQRPAVDQPGVAENPITSYVVTIEPSGRKVTFTGRNVITLEGKHSTFKVISGLKPGTYTFGIAAVNEAGEGAVATTQPVTVQ